MTNLHVIVARNVSIRFKRIRNFVSPIFIEHNSSWFTWFPNWFEIWIIVSNEWFFQHNKKNARAHFEAFDLLCRKKAKAIEHAWFSTSYHIGFHLIIIMNRVYCFLRQLNNNVQQYDFHLNIFRLKKMWNEFELVREQYFWPICTWLALVVIAKIEATSRLPNAQLAG